MTSALLAGTIAGASTISGAGGFALGVRYTLQAARRARAAHNAEENRRRAMQQQELAGMNRDERRKRAQAAARSVSRKAGRS